MLPHERSLVKELGNDFAIVGINDDSKEKLVEMVNDGTTTWRNFTNKQKNGKISDQWGVRGWPTIYLLDQKGIIRYKGVRGEELENAVKELIAQGQNIEK